MRPRQKPIVHAISRAISNRARVREIRRHQIGAVGTVAAGNVEADTDSRRQRIADDRVAPKYLRGTSNRCIEPSRPRLQLSSLLNIPAMIERADRPRASV